MARTVVTPDLDAAQQARATRLVAAGLAATVAAGGVAISYSGDPGAPAHSDTARPAPIIFGDPPVVKGARGGKRNVVTLPMFGDPTVRKGARSGPAHGAEAAARK